MDGTALKISELKKEIAELKIVIDLQKEMYKELQDAHLELHKSIAIRYAD